MSDLPKVTLPSIHLNGTSKEMLFRGYDAVEGAFLELESAINQVEFNARDYYVREGAWQKAQAEFSEAMAQLRAAKQYFSAVQQGIFEGGHSEDRNT